MNEITEKEKYSSTTDSEVPDYAKDIEGWGIDANPDNDPTFPMRHRTSAQQQRSEYLKPIQQVSSVEVLHSNERPGVTSVFGTSTPPSGLSGALRRYAFRFSEGSAGHWLTLILADRVNEVEGVVDDFMHFRFPNIIRERGWLAEWKYNRKSTVKKIATGVAVTAAIVSIILYRRQKKNVA